MMPADRDLFDPEQFKAQLAQAERPLTLFRYTLKQAYALLEQRFKQGEDVSVLVQQRAWLVDQILIQCWHLHFSETCQRKIALVAVGGFGRGELHPGSDIDLMILLDEELVDGCNDGIEKFLMMLWDVGLEVGHSVRTINECVTQAREDITIATNLMEARLIHGAQPLFETMRRNTGPDRIWPSRDFFGAKLQEQITRHNKYNYTAYNLEPNIKEGPGGLRDIQIIGWVAKRHFGANTLHDLVDNDFLTEEEYRSLEQGQAFLWRIRSALHMVSKRREDRLLFDHQRKLAEFFGYRDSEHKLAVELFMRDYYRTIMELGRLNEMLLQLFKEEILYADELGSAKPLNDRFQIRKGFLEATHDQVFKQYPEALLELFVIMTQHPQIKGVRAWTIRLIRENRHLIDDSYRNNPLCTSLFMEILRQPEGVTHELRRMHRYGVLGAYLPAFRNIVGQMQHDLFHVYTVDEHTLSVLRNVRRFSVPEYAHEFPLCSRRFQHIAKPELLYIAALFHDIAKGRGGDHSILGAEDARAFCELHQIEPPDTELISWLIEQHLLMSQTAQRRDLSDPDVINEFAALVKTQARLDHLYLLTVADIRGTSPAVWNSWKDALLKELYHATQRALSRGLDNPLEQSERIHYTKKLAMEQLALHRISAASAQALWDKLSEEYFLMHTADEVAWQTQQITQATPDQLPLVVIRQVTRRGGTEIFLYADDCDELFAKATAALEMLGLSIADARIITSADGHTLDTFIILDNHGEPISDPNSLVEIEACLKTNLSPNRECRPVISNRPAQQLKHFPIPTEVSFYNDAAHKRTIMKVSCADRPGVLARIGAAFGETGVRLHNAKIATFGERVEDIFFVTDKQNHPLTEQAEALRDAIIRQLDSQ